MFVAIYRCIDYCDPTGLHPFRLPAALVVELHSRNSEFLVFILTWRQLRRMLAAYVGTRFPNIARCTALGEEAMVLAPRATWCYSNEDVVGGDSRLGMSVGLGSRSRIGATRVFEIYLGHGNQNAATGETWFRLN